MAERLEFDTAPQAPTSAPAGERRLEFDAPATDGASPTERKLMAEKLKALVEGRNAGGGGSYTERMTDWIVPGIKNVMGGVLALPGSEGTLGERWRAGVGAEKAFREQNREKTAGPVGYAADVAGLVGSAGSPAGAATAGAGPTVAATEKATMSLPKAIATGATQGGISGAAEHSEDLGSATAGGLLGAGIGGATAGATHTVLGALMGRQAANAERQALRGPAPEALFDQARQKFSELDKAGISFDQAQAKRLAGMLPKTLKDANYTASAAPELTDALTKLGNVGAPGAKPLTFTELQSLRDLVSENSRSPLNPNLRRISGRVTAMIDDFVQNNAPAVNKSGADLARLYPEARKLWRTGLLGDTLQGVEEAAALKAAAPGGSTDASDIARRTLAQQAAKETKPGAFSPYTAEQQAARRVAIEGDRTQQALEAIHRGSKLWPAQAGTGAVIGGLGTAVGLPLPGIVAGSVAGPAVANSVGGVAKSLANTRAQNSMDELVRAIMTGSRAPPTQWNMSRADLAKLLAIRGATRAAGQAAPSSIMNP